MSKNEIEAIQFSSDKTLYTFYAIYTVTKFKYTFKNPNDSVAYQEDVAAGTKITNPLTHVVFSYLDASLALEEGYKALGFVADKANSIVASENDFKKHEVKVENIISQNWDREFYVCYMKTDVHENVLSEDLFEFNTESVTYGDDSWSGLRISPKSGVVLSGKVTLPSTHNGLPVISIAGFYGNTALTHVFWQSGCQLRQVNGALQTSSCFSNCSALVYFEMPETLIRISDYAFANTALMSFNFNDGLKQIGMGAFQASKSPVTSIKIPGSVENIAMQAFAFPGGTWKDITFGDIGDPT
jgi:hypothetical protein